jgi:transketolase
MNTNTTQIDAINTLRFLCVDMIQQANSGHPGLPLGCASLAFTIWTQHLRHNPHNPKWPGRDRFILSGGHGSALLYSLLHLTGYELSCEQLKKFRQLNSITPGHPEYGLTPGVEVTTGPLGQGFANGIGMAIAQAHLASEFNTNDNKIFDSHIYAIVTDGDLMEGITAEAASLAGHIQLGKIIYLYDDNHITIDGSTEISFTEDRGKRFQAYDWQVLYVDDGDDIGEINKAILEAKIDPRPSLIICKTIIGKGLPTRQGTNKAHGEPPGKDELELAKLNAGWPLAPNFYIPEHVANFYRQAIEHGKSWEEKWQKKVDNLLLTNPEKSLELSRRLEGKLPTNGFIDLESYKPDVKGIATRVASGQIINKIAGKIPELIGGAADLTPSTKTWINGSAPFQKNSPEGRNIHFGIREHAMGAIVNGMAVFGGIIPFGATFLVFSDYMRTPLRLSALSGYPSIWVFTHDSIGVGEDGPTHQPVEQLASLRAIPGMVVLRPSDANETIAAWKVAISRRNGPTSIILTRQDVPIFDRSIYKEEQLEKGAYILHDVNHGEPEIILMASGSEVDLIIQASIQLGLRSIKSRVVSFPSWELFSLQSTEYKDNVLLPSVSARLAVEAGVSQGWEQWVGGKGCVLGINHFGASAPYHELYSKFEITCDKIVEKALDILNKS